MSPPRKIILSNGQSPGDIVMLTGAVRDLHRCHPGEFLVDVRTKCPELWRHHPGVTALDEADPNTERIEMRYPLVEDANGFPGHFLHGFIAYLNEVLETSVRPTECRGDLHLSAEERRRPSPVEAMTGVDLPYWVIVAGGKHDCSVKWWESSRYQEVVDRFADRILFVQVGRSGDFHPRLRGVLDLVGRTDLREWVRLIHHAAGVLCPVTAAMHLAAAVPVRREQHPLRPCVVVAGGREPPHWEAYPGHQFIHTVGMLPCCGDGGCWKSRTVPLSDGSRLDAPRHVCVRSVEGRIPQCMDLISAEEVIRRIEGYHDGGVARYLTAEEAATASATVATVEPPERTGRNCDGRLVQKPKNGMSAPPTHTAATRPTYE